MPSALEEKDAIREVLAEYCFRLDDGRFAEMAALFTENGTWDTAFGRATGRTAIAELARNIRAQAGDQRPRGIHLVTNIAITLDGASARVRSTGPLSRTARTGQRSAPAGHTKTNWSKLAGSGCSTEVTLCERIHARLALRNRSAICGSI